MKNSKPILSIDMRMIESSGIGTYLKNIVPALIQHRPHWEFRLFGDTSILGHYFSNNNITLVDFNIPIYSIREQIQPLLQWFKKTNLFWCPHFNIPIFSSSKLLVTIHDVFHLANPELVHGIHKQLYAKYIFSIIKKKADGIICVSEFTKSEFLKYLPHPSIDPMVIHNGLDPSWFELKRTSTTQPYILYVGPIKPHKNLLRLLKAFETIQSLIPHQLLLVGKYEGLITYDNDVLQEVQKSKGRIQLIGSIANTDTFRNFYAQADVLALPSLYEGFGFPGLEAMACQCPVLASDIKVFHEIYQDAVLYCDPYSIPNIASQLLKIIRDHPLRETLIAAGSHQAKRYSWNTCALQTLHYIETLIESTQDSGTAS
jgi:glycosyltransferase involved in cell wall biosynthesis